MKTIYFDHLKDYIGKELTIEGFVDSIRDLAFVQFVVLRDTTSKIQVTILKDEQHAALNKIISNIKIESTLKVTGKLVQNEKVKLHQMELLPTDIVVTSYCLEDLPFNYKDSQSTLLDTRLNKRFLDLRNEKNLLLFQVQTCLVQAMREFVLNNKFIELHTPKLIGAASESGAEVFELQYFNKKAYLAQSPQFYKQMAMCSGFEKVFEVAPVFRAERSNSYRHATEFTSFDVEMSYIEKLEDLMKFEEDLIVFAFQKVRNNYGEKIKELFGVDVVVPTKPFPRIKLEDLYQKLEEVYHYQMNFEDIGDMNAESEKLAADYIQKTFGHQFVFITDFSAKKRAFYHKRENGIPQGADLIFKGCEITTLALREHRYEILCQQAKEKGLGKDVSFYLDFFRYGCPPHGGFAIGVERLTMLLLGLPSLKETMFLFRGPNHLEP